MVDGVRKGAAPRLSPGMNTRPVRDFRPDVYWYRSLRCNLACEHCSAGSSPGADAWQELDTSESMRVVEQLVDLDVSTVFISGGEPLIRTDHMGIF